MEKEQGGEFDYIYNTCLNYQNILKLKKFFLLLSNFYSNKFKDLLESKIKNNQVLKISPLD